MRSETSYLGIFQKYHRVSIDVLNEAVADRLQQNHPRQQVLYVFRLHDEANNGFGCGQ